MALAVAILTGMNAVATNLFSTLDLRGVRFRNRIAVSPMCQYSSEDGFANEWHLVHLGSRAVGGAGAVIAEATAVDSRGRITPNDLGIWKDAHVEFLSRIASFVKAGGAVAGIQLAHAGRKASARRPWEGGTPISKSDGGWETVAPSAIPFREDDPTPHELTRDEIHQLVNSFAAAAKRSLDAGFELVEVHGAHGYLIHEFLSPLSNRRADEYGGSLENRLRFALEVNRAVRNVWPERLPLWFRISASDWAQGGWTIEDSIELARRVRSLGVDLIDCSSGGLVAHQKIALAPGYQMPFSERIRREAGIATGGVGLITTPEQADEIIREGRADVVLLARQFLRDPYFPLHAAKALGVEMPPPVQYGRAF